MKKLVPFAVAFLAINCIVGCSGGDSISEEDSIGPDLKRAGVDPKPESKNQGMPKVDETTTGK